MRSKHVHELDETINRVIRLKSSDQLRSMLLSITNSVESDLPPVMWSARRYFSVKINMELRLRDGRRKISYARTGHATPVSIVNHQS